ncbi:MAG: Uma2 family endonuclease, partial [Planctomycetota bacterium]
LRDWADHPGFLPLAPDLVAEVVSPNDESSKVEAKATAWLQAGVRVVLVVDPQTRSIREYRAPDSIRVYRNGEVDLGDLLPDFKLDVLDLFK